MKALLKILHIRQ